MVDPYAKHLRRWGLWNPPDDVVTLKRSTFWNIREELPKPLTIGLLVASIAVPLAIWWAIATAGIVQPEVLMPPPAQVWAKGVELWQKGILPEDIRYSLFRVLAGYAIGLAFALPLGIFMGTFATGRWAFEPLIGLLRYMPAPAFTPLFLVYLGLGEAPKIALIALGTFFFNTLMVMDGVKFISKDLIDTSYTLGANRKQVVAQVILPALFPTIVDATRINLAAAWNLVIVAELLSAEQGLGKRIALAQRFLGIDQMFACLIVIGVIGLSFDLALRALLRFTCSWAEDAR
ncbi:MAG: ABC transporter permease [Cyanobacteria bacterium P01_A01_bin.3]